MQRFVVPDPEEDFTADPVELFFDLAFVFAFSQLVGRLVGDPSPAGMAETALLFMMLWVPWSTFTWAANAVSGNNRVVRAVFLVATAVSVPMAASISVAYGAGGALFGIPLAVILAMAVLLSLLPLDRSSAVFRSALAYSVPNAIAMLLLIVGSLTDGSLRLTFWIAGLAVVIFATIRAGSGDWLVRPGHFAERHGLIVIVALGEVIVAIAIAVVAGLTEGSGVSTDTATALVGAGAFAAFLWWGYFDRPQRGLEYRAEELSGRERSRFVRDVYTYFHILIVSGIVLAAAALEEITLHPSDGLPPEFRAMLLIGLAFFLLGIDGAVLRAFGFFPPERAIAVLATGVLLIPDLGLPGLVLLLLIDGILLTMLVIEHFRIERYLQERRRTAAETG